MAAMFEFMSDAMFNTHAHLRQGPQVWPLIELSIKAGVDTLHYMPNPGTGLKTQGEVRAYDNYAREHDNPKGMRLVPSFMFTEETTEKVIDECVEDGILDGKVYPEERTNSPGGVKRYMRLLPNIRHCGKRGVRVHVHPEHPSNLVESRDAELLFIPIVQAYLEETEATIIWEHGSDARCIPLWKEWAKSGRFYVGLTAHHLAANEDMVFGDVRATCKPPIKTERDRHDLVRLVEEGHSWVMAGLDDANHPQVKKHVRQGCCACGAATTGFGLQLYAHALDKLLQRSGGREIFQRFTSGNARKLFGGLPAHRHVRLKREEFTIPMVYEIGDWIVEPFWAGQKILYSLG